MKVSELPSTSPVGMILPRHTSSTQPMQLEMRPCVHFSDTMIFMLSVPTSNDTHPVSGALYHNPRRLAKRTRHPVGCEQLYTAASIFFAGTTRTRDVLFLYCDVDQTHEAAHPRSGSGPHTNGSRVQPDAGLHQYFMEFIRRLV